MNPITWFLNLFKPNKKTYYTGVNPDTRTEAARALDYIHEERVMPASGIVPYSNPQLTKSPYFYENQWQVGSCEPHGVGLALAIERFKEIGVYQRLSWLFNYRLRSVYPEPGCFLQDVFNKYQMHGAPVYQELPDVTSEEEATAVQITPQMTLDGAVFKGLAYFLIANANNIDTLNAIADQEHAVAITLFATYQEWAQEYPAVVIPSLKITDASAVVNHCVCVLPNSGFMLNGKRYLAIQDSAWFGNYMLRYVSEDFIEARVYSAGYWDKALLLGTGPRPKHVFMSTLVPGMRNAEVQIMQQLLISEYMLPSDCATGYFGGMTLAGVHAFQEKYAADILTPQGITRPTNTWGNGCITKANELCS